MIKDESYNLDVLSTSNEYNFPEGTKLHFVFWSHVYENYPSLIPALEDENVIAVEYSATDNIDRFSTLMDSYNAVLQGTANSEQEDNLRGNRDVGAYLADHFRGSGKLYVPIDSWVYSEDRQHRTQRKKEVNAFGDLDEKNVLDHALSLAHWAFEREVLSMHQLSKIASNLIDQGREPRIAVLYGRGHNTLYHLAKKLGINATREFPNNDPGEYSHALGALAQMMRYQASQNNDLSESYSVRISDDIKKYATAVALGNRIINDLSKETAVPNGIRNDILFELESKSALLAQRLASKDPKTRHAAEQIVIEFENRNRKKMFGRNAKQLKAAKRLLELVKI